MALNRRPARFERRHNSMPSHYSSTITQQKLHLLRTAAARVYIIHNNQKEEALHNNNQTASESGALVVVEEEEAEAEADPEHGVKLLAAAACPSTFISK